MKKQFLKTLNTAIIGFCFILLLCSIIGLFFGFKIFYLHIILGICLVFLIFLHLLCHLEKSKKYLSKNILKLFKQDEVQKKYAKKYFIQSCLDAPLELSFKILKIDYEEAKKKLLDLNIKIEDYKNLKSLAKNSSLSYDEVLALFINMH